MPKDPARAAAARLATLVAVPVALIVGLASFWWAGGRDAGGPAVSRPQSSAPVGVPATPLTGTSAAVCRALVAKLPAAVRSAARRPVTAEPAAATSVVEQAAAYGDPAMVLTCAAPAAAAAPDGVYFGLDGVCWYAAQAAADTTVWTTVDRQVPVRVTVPGAYPQPGQWVINFSAPIAAADPPLADPPSGCGNPRPTATS
ncbi:hypothetical protein GCM10009682_46410 [Luedemannella flava]|uniref:DUF3515 domain-containing protein n=1 Tax=Luedemannella flava TaxID=349316 RepID=A0ABP4YL20_9ACTN